MYARFSHSGAVGDDATFRRCHCPLRDVPLLPPYRPDKEELIQDSAPCSFFSLFSAAGSPLSDLDAQSHTDKTFFACTLNKRSMEVTIFLRFRRVSHLRQLALLGRRHSRP